MNNVQLTPNELLAVFDVLNVYDPNDIKDVYPEMASKEFLGDVKSEWSKVLNVVKETDNGSNN